MFLTHQILYTGNLLYDTCIITAWHIPDAMYTVLELLMMGEETTRNMKNLDNNKEYCVTLNLVCCIEKNTLTMYGHMEVKFNTV
jgi:hypothetical protein